MSPHFFYKVYSRLVSYTGCRYLVSFRLIRGGQAWGLDGTYFRPLSARKWWGTKRAIKPITYVFGYKCSWCWVRHHLFVVHSRVPVCRWYWNVGVTSDSQRGISENIRIKSWETSVMCCSLVEYVSSKFMFFVPAPGIYYRGVLRILITVQVQLGVRLTLIYSEILVTTTKR